MIGLHCKCFFFRLHLGYPHTHYIYITYRFNPKVTRVLNVRLVHTLEQSSVVCCVKFSADGRYLAAGCNRITYIYEVSTAREICTLEDTTVQRDGDLYIRSVCFSPDGNYLATGAEDKQIRVSAIQD